ncbi:hypothetical protein L3X38_009330 [Prunus dulcis]|uniref:Uncharacterized protein n=1 Tax=Prunus dulcis TaxID=3755 RepID=A0AAD5F891_PRUDU|nr:hypothetical protein L3X38_009330 [Prunus dulcis]
MVGGGVLQEEGRVEEAPDADESAPPRHSRPRHRSGGLRRLPCRRASLQPPHFSFCCFLISRSFSLSFRLYHLCYSLSFISQMGAPAQHEEQSLEFLSFKMLLLLLEWLHLKIASVESACFVIFICL